MRIHGLVPRLLVGLALLVGGGLALVGGLSLRPAGLLAIGLAAAVTGALAAGIAREGNDHDLRATVEAAWQAAACTVAVLLVLCGTSAVGGALLTVVVGCVGAVAALVVWWVRSAARPAGGPARPAPVQDRPAGRADSVSFLAPVRVLSTEDLGREWLRTSVALSSSLDPSARQTIVRRRQETLDELERRDPVGFARWLAAGPLPGADPARYLDGNAASDAA
ncbi:hypothetical protein [Blastococcus sp. SYSU D00820]